jgi:hypothetical protein
MKMRTCGVDKGFKLPSVAAAMLLAVVISLCVAQSAFAEYLSPYPTWTYSTTNAGTSYREDPVNILFGGTAYSGYYGSAAGVCERYINDTYPLFMNVTASTQYVLFKTNLNNQTWRSSSRNIGDANVGNLVPRYHLRLFQDPYPTSGGSYAECNCVSDAHHEGSCFTEHTIDMDWEVAEHYALNTIHNANPDNTIWIDNIYNGATSIRGWYSDGYLSKASLNP